MVAVEDAAGGVIGMGGVAVVGGEKASIEGGERREAIAEVGVVGGPTFGSGEGSRREMFGARVGRLGRRQRGVVGAGGRVGWWMALSLGQVIGREGFGDEVVVGGSRRLAVTSFGRLDVGAWIAGLCSSWLMRGGEVIG